MNAEPTTEDTTEEQIRRFTTRSDFQPYMRFIRLLPWISGVLILTLIPRLLDQSQDAPLKLILLLVLAFPLIIALTLGTHIVHQSHKQKALILSGNDVIYQTYFYTLKTSLDNVRLIRDEAGDVWALQLKQPGEISQSFLFGASSPEKQLIPLIAFEDPRSEGELYRYFQNHLIEKHEPS